MKKWMTGIIYTIVAVLVLAACGGSDEGDASGMTRETIVTMKKQKFDLLITYRKIITSLLELRNLQRM